MNGSPHASGSLPEEPWEAEVSAALSALPSIEPPAGFMARATDHRPLHAGRSLAFLAATAAVGIGLSLAVEAGSVADDPSASASAGQAESVGGLRSLFPPLDAPVLDEVGQGVVSLARQLGLPAD
ncbi:MAG: hypothetical protein AAGD35_07165 [Actinomycetota bacterium]